ncbi:MAG TPA: hypothetical protein VG267_11260 [Terracidiphilus sp.]|jgi:hypothetical protein|nr:hypothetical protein [Terracidiphilus sp.]
MSSVEAQTLVPIPGDSLPLIAGAGGRGLRRVWLRLLVFVLPIVLVLAPIVYWVDPFALFPKDSAIPIELRSHYAGPINQDLWKIFAFNRKPAPNIVLGDSQVARLSEEDISSVTGMQYSNLGAGGATLRETISVFWFASRKAQLRHVYFGVNFMGYNADPRDRVPQAEGILKDPVVYCLNSDVLEAGVYDIGEFAFHHHTDLGPQVNREAFWQSQLQYLAARYKRDADPGTLRDKLREVVQYSHEHGIAFTFIIPPEHVDARQRVRQLGVEAQYQQFKDDLAGMAPVLDCDVDSPLTEDKDSFSDPFHLTDSAANRLVSDLWSGHSTYCRSLGSR